jgi:DNA-binding NarL/FixJ family response regulator
VAYTILIIDDSAIVRLSLRQLLERQSDLQVRAEAENGWEGIAPAQKFDPDLIVLDLAMPLMNGLDTARKLRKIMPAVPLVMFNAFKIPH